MNTALQTSDLPAEVTAILDWWRPRVCEVFGDELQGVFLFGGLALGEFAPGWSDVDTYLIVGSPVTAEQADAMNAMLAEMDERFINHGAEGWRSGQAVQGAVVTSGQAAEVGRAEECFYAWGSKGVHKHCDPFSAFDRYQLAHHRKLIWGDDVYFAPPSREALVEMTVEGMNLFGDAAEGPGKHGPIMLAGLLHWVARSFVFWRDCVLVAKSAALRQEIDRGSPFADVFSLALDVREQGSASAAEHEEALRKVFRESGRAINAEHERILGSCGPGCGRGKEDR
jgi:hypothetical protein